MPGTADTEIYEPVLERQRLSRWSEPESSTPGMSVQQMPPGTLQSAGATANSSRSPHSFAFTEPRAPGVGTLSMPFPTASTISETGPSRTTAQPASEPSKPLASNPTPAENPTNAGIHADSPGNNNSAGDSLGFAHLHLSGNEPVAQPHAQPLPAPSEATSTAEEGSHANATTDEDEYIDDSVTCEDYEPISSYAFATI